MIFIPPELTDRIIDFLHNDCCALRTCAIVCREWLPASRFHIFQNYRPRFDRQLIERSPQIGHLIRKVRITKHFDSDPGGYIGSLDELRELFPNVDDVLVSGLESSMWNFQSMLDIMSSLPALRAFGIEFMEIPVVDVMPSEISRNSVQVLHLWNVDWDLLLFMDRAIAADAFASVRTLHYTCNCKHYGEGLLRFLRHYGSNLVEFRLSELPAESSDETLDSDSLACLTNIRDLHIGVRFFDSSISALKQWLSKYLHKLFATISSESPLRVSFHFHFPNYRTGYPAVSGTEYGPEFIVWFTQTWDEMMNTLPKLPASKSDVRISLTLESRLVVMDNFLFRRRS